MIKNVWYNEPSIINQEFKMIICSALAQEKSYNVDDFVAFCEHSQYAWYEHDSNSMITSEQLKDNLLGEYAEYLLY